MLEPGRTPSTYAQAGVSVTRGDAFVDRIKKLRSDSLGRIGGFAGGHEIDLAAYRRPVLLSATDGVGTKLLVARELGKYDTVGIDLVAMCVNDLIVCGAKPISFLDYIACGRLNPDVLEDVVKGILTGCEQAGCRLDGGETAELPDMYGPDDIDLAGFCTGIVEADRMLPRPSEIVSGTVVLGAASSGIHSNGFSLARKVIEHTPDNLSTLLTPTRIYVSLMERLLETGKIFAAAHITGGGLFANTARVVPERLRLQLDGEWPVPSIFPAIQKAGHIPDKEMAKVFNMGIGLAVLVNPRDAETVRAAAGEQLYSIGRIIDG